MKGLVAVLFLMIVPNAFAEEYCSNVKNQIAVDHQWKESDFTKQNADHALSKLQDAVNEKGILDWYESTNYYALIEGYLLMNAIKRNSNDKDRKYFHIANFCNFLTSRPIVD